MWFMRRMRENGWQAVLLIVIALAGCRGDQPAGGNGAAPGSPQRGPVQTDTLTGLYEGGSGARRNQLCMIEREGGRASFGFVVWGPGETSCSGSGPATRSGNRLELRLDGDESCALEAAIDGRRVTLPASMPEQCARYYCGTGASMTGATFDKVAGAEADAMRAVDLVGDPLCAN